MIEKYLFFAMFPVQILAMSVLYPIGFTRLTRTTLARIPPERLAEFYPHIDVEQAHARFLDRYRVANSIIALLGAVLLAWFIHYMRQPGWDEGNVSAMLVGYFILQNLPTAVAGWFTTRFDKLHRRPRPDAKRKAVLQRRGPFDFVSPLVVLLAILSYALFVAFNFYVARHPFEGYAGPLVNIVLVTLAYAMFGAVVYWFLYRRKVDPLQTHADRMGMFRMIATTYTWMCILIPAFISLDFARRLLDLETWSPFVGAASFVIVSFLSLWSVRARPRQADDLAYGPPSVHAPNGR